MWFKFTKRLWPGFLWPGLLSVGLLTSTVSSADTFKTRPDGPDAERLGIKQGYPVCPQALTRLECRVGTWSANDKVANSSVVRASEQPLLLPPMVGAPPITYRWGFSGKTLDDFMAETKTTGLMVLKEGQVVAERYQVVPEKFIFTPALNALRRT